MPEIDGFGFLRMLEAPPPVIFTTAHSEFAVENYEYNAVDYLKKPIPFERFLKAVNKAMQWIDNKVPVIPQKKSIELRIDGYVQTVQLDKIFYIQSLGNYVKVFMNRKNWRTSYLKMLFYVSTNLLSLTAQESAAYLMKKYFLAKRFYPLVKRLKNM